MMSRRKFKAWVNSLVNEGYDLSDYTWDELYEEYLEEAPASRATNQRLNLGVVRGGRSGFTVSPSDSPRAGESTSQWNARRQQALALANRLNRETGTGSPTQRATNQRLNLGVVSGGRAGYTISSSDSPRAGESTSQWNARRQQALALANRLNSQTASSRQPATSQGGGSYSGGGGSRSTPAAAPRPAAPVLSKQGGVEGTGVGKDFKARNWSDTEKNRYANLAQSRAAASSAPASRPPTPAIGTLGKTQFERRTPTSVELRGAQGEPKGSSAEQRLQAAQTAQRNATNNQNERAKSMTRELTLSGIPGTSSSASSTSTPANPAITKPSNTLTQDQIRNRRLNMSFDFGKSNYISEDINYLYQSIYEGSRVDQDADGDNDGADVMIARMVASGMSREEAIRRTRNKPYNKRRKTRKEDYDLYSLVLDYMIESGYADDVERAEAIFENLTTEFQNAIIDEVENP